MNILSKQGRLAVITLSLLDLILEAVVDLEGINRKVTGSEGLEKQMFKIAMAQGEREAPGQAAA